MRLVPLSIPSVHTTPEHIYLCWASTHRISVKLIYKYIYIMCIIRSGRKVFGHLRLHLPHLILIWKTHTKYSLHLHKTVCTKWKEERCTFTAKPIKRSITGLSRDYWRKPYHRIEIRQKVLVKCVDIIFLVLYSCIWWHIKKIAYLVHTLMEYQIGLDAYCTPKSLSWRFAWRWIGLRIIYGVCVCVHFLEVCLAVFVGRMLSNQP